MRKSKFVIEDRTAKKPPVHAAGKFVLWQEVSYPFPMRLFSGSFDTKKEALAKRRELMAEAVAIK